LLHSEILERENDLKHMKKTVFLIILFIIHYSMFGQIWSCGNEDEDKKVEIERRLQIQKIKNAHPFSKSAGINYIAIKMHLFGLDNGTGYLDANSINDALAELNRQFKPINVEFYFSGTDFNYYPNTLFNNANQTSIEDAAFHTTNGVNNAMNLYVSSVVKSPPPSGPVSGGWSYITPNSQFYNRTWISSSQFNDNKTTIHEVGHYFGLLHTFNNSTNTLISARELVTRNFNESSPRFSANCRETGDYVCDTPSDPRGNGNATVTNCSYSGTVRDANSDLFKPDVSNYMDYNFCAPNYFTGNQYSRMADGLLIVKNNSNNFTLTAPETLQNPPSNLLISNSSFKGYINLSWKDNSSVETGYIIERGTSPEGPFIPLAGVKANTTVCNNLLLVPFSDNYFRVKPSNSKSNYSFVSSPIIGIPPSISIIGSTIGTPWTTDVELSTTDGEVYTLNNYTITQGEAKFRQNFTWSPSSIDWGSIAFPSGTAITSGPNIPIPSGMYSIIFNRITGAYQFNTSLGTRTVDFENSWIYPNPVKNRLFIQPSPKITIEKIVVTDFSGKIILSQSQDFHSISVEQLARGMYFVTLFSGDKQYSNKFIKE